MKYLILLVLFFCHLYPSLSQDYSYFSREIEKLYQTKTPEMAAKSWMDFTDHASFPFVYGDSVAFFYKGDAKAVSWMGDFNGWGYDKSFKNKGVLIPGTDIWILKASFPKDARLDYKIVVDETNWMLDPLNYYQQWSGVGGGSPNSELRMPDWKADPMSILNNAVPRGAVERDILFNSKILGYQITYSAYLPRHYKPTEKYPVIYVTDGYEYLHEHMGNMSVILDNLIDQHKIVPVVAFFIDHREPVNRSNNRRMQELDMNEKYLHFFTDEFVPSIEKKYSITSDPGHRAILGASMGGLTAAYFSFSKPEIFGLAGIQSPAFWFKTDIYSFCDNPNNPPIKTFMTTGLVYDAQEGARKMKNILEKNTCAYQYKEVNQGHSWGNWRDTIDDILIYFFPASE